MQNSSEDSALSSHLTVTCRITSELASSVVFNSLIEFMMKAISTPLALYSAKHSSIHMRGINSFF